MVIAYHLILSAYGFWLPNDGQHLSHAIAYVENNPVKSGFKRQRWSFVKPVRGSG